MRLALVVVFCLTIAAGCVPSAIQSNLPHTPGCDDPNVEQMLRAKFGDQGDHAVRIAIRESHCQPGARNSSGASGVMQLMVPLHSDLLAAVCLDADPFWAECNIDAAKLLYNSAGWAPWGG